MNEDSLLEFPCEFPLKAIGREPEGFEAFVVEIIRKHVATLAADATTSRLSNGGNYLAVTVTFTAESRAQLDAIYEELGSHKQRVVMLL